MLGGGNDTGIYSKGFYKSCLTLSYSLNWEGNISLLKNISLLA